MFDLRKTELKIFLDGASLADMARLADKVDGFTTNPSLMKQAGISDYRNFAKEVLAIADGKPASFEVLSDESGQMMQQAAVIAGWSENVYVKIPVVNTGGTSCLPMVASLAKEGIKVNVTAVLSATQAAGASYALLKRTGIVSVFAGRIADTGRDPAPIVQAAKLWGPSPELDGVEVLWASAREILNVEQAAAAGADIITLSAALLEKRLALRGKDLDEYSMETVRQFLHDADGLKI